VAQPSGATLRHGGLGGLHRGGVSVDDADAAGRGRPGRKA
jgi:hypothetical protein